MTCVELEWVFFKVDYLSALVCCVCQGPLEQTWTVSFMRMHTKQRHIFPFFPLSAQREDEVVQKAMDETRKPGPDDKCKIM